MVPVKEEDEEEPHIQRPATVGMAVGGAVVKVEVEVDVLMDVGVRVAVAGGGGEVGVRVAVGSEPGVLV